MNVWKWLFLITSGAVLFMGYRFGVGLYGYNRLSKQAPAEVVSWEIREVKQDTFGIVATYFFNEGGVHKYTFKPPYYPNEHAAKASIKRMQGLSWHALYDPKQENVSALQRYFPYKAAIHFGLSVGVLLYFIWLYEYSSTANLRK